MGMPLVRRSTRSNSVDGTMETAGGIVKGGSRSGALSCIHDLSTGMWLSLGPGSNWVATASLLRAAAPARRRRIGVRRRDDGR